jgi:carbon monoxide dehydrogenase subunit G
MSTFETTIDIEAPIEKVWEALADIGSISKWNPGVHESYATSDETTGLGATRFCDLGGKNFVKEQVVEFETCRKLTMRVTGTNMPMEEADIHFTLVVDGGHTRVTCAPGYTLKYGPLGSLMDRFYVRGNYEKSMQSLLRGLKDHVEGQAGDRLIQANPYQKKAILAPEARSRGFQTSQATGSGLITDPKPDS